MHRAELLWAALALATVGCEQPSASSTKSTASSAPVSSSSPTAAAASGSAAAGAPTGATSASTFSPGQEAALKKAEAAAMSLAKKLKGELKGSLDQGDHAAAVKVCSERAPEVGASVHEETGVKVGRSSLRLRNAKNAPPDWVATWLDAMGDRKAADAKPLRAVAEGPEGPVARIIKPLEVGGLCVLCHGEASGMSKELSAAIAERYPEDQATGYAVGDLRGALWAEVAVAK